MPVFISHKKLNREGAIGIASYLKSRGIKCYVDEFDPSLQTTSDITSAIINRVKAWTHLMAVVSENTNSSWWVPFEIGVASEVGNRIVSFPLSEGRIQAATINTADVFHKTLKSSIGQY